jgi:hypothetical protein
VSSAASVWWFRGVVYITSWDTSLLASAAGAAAALGGLLPLRHCSSWLSFAAAVAAAATYICSQHAADACRKPEPNYPPTATAGCFSSDVQPPLQVARQVLYAQTALCMPAGTTGLRTMTAMEHIPPAALLLAGMARALWGCLLRAPTCTSKLTRCCWCAQLDGAVLDGAAGTLCKIGSRP